MAIQDVFDIDSNKKIIYTGGAHGTSTAEYYKVSELYNWLMWLAGGNYNSYLNISTPIACDWDESLNTLILINRYTLDQNAAEHLYGGTIIDVTADLIYFPVINYGNLGVQIRQFKDGQETQNQFWNTVPYNEFYPGINKVPEKGITHQFLVPESINNNLGCYFTNNLEYGTIFQTKGVILDPTKPGEEVILNFTYIVDDFNNIDIENIKDIANNIDITERAYSEDIDNDSQLEEFALLIGTKDGSSITKENLYNALKYIQSKDNTTGAALSLIPSYFSKEYFFGFNFKVVASVDYGDINLINTNETYILEIEYQIGDSWESVLALMFYNKKLSTTEVEFYGTIIQPNSAQYINENNSIFIYNYNLDELELELVTISAELDLNKTENLSNQLAGALNSLQIFENSFGIIFQDSARNNKEIYNPLNKNQVFIEPPAYQPELINVKINNLTNQSYLFVAAATDTGEINFNQFSTLTETAQGETTIQISTEMPDYIPESGTLRLLENGIYKKYTYSSRTQNTFNLTEPVSSIIPAGTSLYITYIDKLVSAPTEEIVFTNPTSDINIYVKNSFVKNNRFTIFETSATVNTYDIDITIPY